MEVGGKTTGRWDFWVPRKVMHLIRYGSSYLEHFIRTPSLVLRGSTSSEGRKLRLW